MGCETPSKRSIPYVGCHARGNVSDVPADDQANAVLWRSDDGLLRHVALE